MHCWSLYIFYWVGFKVKNSDKYYMAQMDELDCVLWNLETLSKLRPGQRINTQHEYITIEPENSLQPFYRWWWGDGRERSRQAISHNVNVAVLVSDAMLESIYLDTHSALQVVNDDKTAAASERVARIRKIKKIIRGLKHAMSGIACLMDSTYKHDENMICHLRKIWSVAEGQFKKLCSFTDTVSTTISERTESESSTASSMN
jgi:hypothetical protein